MRSDVRKAPVALRVEVHFEQESARLGRQRIESEVRKRIRHALICHLAVFHPRPISQHRILDSVSRFFRFRVLYFAVTDELVGDRRRGVARILLPVENVDARAADPDMLRQLVNAIVFAVIHEHHVFGIDVRVHAYRAGEVHQKLIPHEREVDSVREKTPVLARALVVDAEQI